jgi:hypothetical protein
LHEFALLLIVVTNNRFVYLTYLTLAGLLGIFLIAVGLYSLHREVLWNYNALLFNPLYLPLVISILRKNSKQVVFFIKLNTVLLLIYTVYLAFQSYFTVLLPFIVTNGFILFRLYRWEKKSIK